MDRFEQPTVASEKRYFMGVLDERMLEFVQEELRPKFGFLLTFLAELESAALSADNPASALDSIPDGLSFSL